MPGSINVQFAVQIGAVAMLIRTEKGLGRYLGTCFPFRFRHIFLTARHCVGDLDASDLTVLSQAKRGFHVRHVHHHPTADISAVVGDDTEGGIPYPFTGLHVFEGTYGIGDEVAAFGFPIGGTLDEIPNEPTPRVLRGSVQRTARFSSSGSSKPYMAYELSFPATLGLSGGPVFVPGSDRVFAMVTGNQYSHTELPEEEIKERSADEERIIERRIVISYGMALSLWHVEDWLKEVAPLSGHARW